MSAHQLSDYNVAWICALPLELAAACAMLDDRHDPLPLDYDSRDTNNYILGRIESHNVVLACLPYGVIGTVSAARVVSQMLLTFKNIKFGLMIGIGGGAPSAEHDIRLGDVVVGSPTGLLGGVVQYDFGKTVQHGRFQRTGMLNKPSQVLLTAMSRLQARHLMEGHHIGETINGMLARYPAMSIQYSRPSSENDRLYRADYEHPESQPTCSSCDAGQMVTRHSRPAGIPEPYIHYGLIASGDQVVRNAQMRDRLRKELDVLCFEMEAAGLIDSFPCLVVRGISDYADSHKNDLWQGYAAAAAAAYAKELMGFIKAVGNTDSQGGHAGGKDNGSSDLVRFRIQKWLSPAGYKDDLYSHQKEYMNGSCDWALKTHEMQAFMRLHSESQILRIGGAPGIGKSTLAAFLIRRLMGGGNPHVLYFFCKETAEGRSRPFETLRTLLSQALVSDNGNSLLPWVERLRVQSGTESAESFATLNEALRSALASLPIRGNRPLCIVVDALDECEDGCVLASALSAALNDSKRPFRLLLTSREEPELLDFFRRYKEKSARSNLATLRELIILPSFVRQPVVEYIRQRLSQFQHIRATALGQTVFRQTTAAADGSWLYARLIMDEIERLPSPAAVTRQLKNIPNGLVQLYQTIFSAVEKALSPLQLNLAQQLFIWIDIMDFVRVGRGTLDREILDIVFQAANSGDAVFDSVDLAQKLCSPLITLKTVLPQDRYHSRSTNTSTTISVVHRTALEFIRQSSARDTTPTPVPRILKPQALKALYRANTAVWYFEQSENSGFLLDSLAKNSTGRMYGKTGVYFEMSYALWHAFFLRTLPVGLDDDDLEQAALLCNRLTSFLLSGRCMKWIEMAIIVNYNGGYVNLYQNAVTALTAATQSTIISGRDTKGKSLPAFQEFSIARKQFFADYAYVISCTGPTDGETMSMPEGFGGRPSAVTLMKLGMAWEHLYQEESGEESD